MHHFTRIQFGFFLLFPLLLLGCAIQPPESPTASTASDTIPPEPTNTPAPATNFQQSNSPCNVSEIHAQIDTSLRAYQTERSAELDPLDQFNGWMGTVSADIATNCLAAQFETGEREELALLLDQLLAGGNIIYVRHTHTDRSQGDTNTDLGQCETQRLLSERGRDEALFIRRAYQSLNLPIDDIFSTQYCRTLETAVLAFGIPKVILRQDLFINLVELLGTPPNAGQNTIIVAHIGTLRDRVGLDDTFDEGDSLVYRPNDDGSFEFIGRIGLYDWPTLADINQNR